MGAFGDAFRKKLSTWTPEVVRTSEFRIRAMTVQAYRDLVQRAWDVQKEHGSPVASGRFAASWRVALNAPDPSVADADPSYRYPKPAKHKYDANNLPRRTIPNRPISSIEGVMRRYKLGDTIFFSNNVPYFRKIEVGGHSWQTPRGVLEPTLRVIRRRFSGGRGG